MGWHPPVKRMSPHRADAPPKNQAGALITQIEIPTLAKARMLLDFWNDRRATGVMVGRDVPSRAVAPILHSLVIFEPVEDRADLRIRLAGTALLRRFGREVSGSLISHLYPRDHFEIVLSRALSVIATGKPQIDDVVIRNSERTLQHFETVHLPVFAPGGEAVWDMAGYFYFP